MLVGEDVERRVEIGLAKDGSGVGGNISFSTYANKILMFIPAALCALMATKAS